MNNRKTLFIGPFGAAEKKIEEFSANILAAYLLSGSIVKYEQSKIEYETALLTDSDKESIRRKKMTFEASQISMSLAARIYHNAETEEEIAND
jgi:hypothetical protein